MYLDLLARGHDYTKRWLTFILLYIHLITFLRIQAPKDPCSNHQEEKVRLPWFGMAAGVVFVLSTAMVSMFMSCSVV